MGISVKGLAKSYGSREVLSDVSFEIEEGQFVTFLGPTDAGKTTLLRLMAGIEKPDAGSIEYDGKALSNIPSHKRPISFVYQQFVNYPSFTIYENIASPLRVSKMKRSAKEIDQIVRKNAELLGISHVLDHYPEQVSGGQQQRTAIARALAKNAKYMFFDEPLANLDYKLREELRGELRAIFAERGGAVVYATPEPVDALSMSTHVGLLHEGRLIQFGRAREVYESPTHVDVGRHFSHPAMNILACTVARQDEDVHLSISDECRVEVTQVAQSLTKDRYLLGVRAHCLSMAQKESHFAAMSGTVLLSEVVGSDTEVHVSHKGQSFIVLLQNVTPMSIGSEITIYLDTKQCYIFDADTKDLVATTFDN